MRYLITGGAGFIGSHLADRLTGRGDEVWIVDDLSTGSIYNIEHLKEHPKFHYVIDTILNAPVLAELVDRCDVVVHLAAAVGGDRLEQQLELVVLQRRADQLGDGVFLALVRLRHRCLEQRHLLVGGRARAGAGCSRCKC